MLAFDDGQKMVGRQTEILKNKKIVLSAKADRDAAKPEQITTLKTGNLKIGDKKRLFKKLASEFGINKEYFNRDIDLKFRYSLNDVAESAKKQKRNYQDLALLFTCFDEVVEQAIGIEVHNRNEEGYKPNQSLKDVHVLVSAFEDGDRIVPVKLEVKELLHDDNTLYVAIALSSIKKSDIVKLQGANKGVAYNSPSLSEISVAQLLSEINPEDTGFVKYIPEQFRKQVEEKKQFSTRDDYAFDLWQEIEAEEADAAGRDSVFYVDEDDPTKVTYSQEQLMEEMSKGNDTVKAMNVALHQAIGEGNQVDVEKFATEQARKLRRVYGTDVKKSHLALMVGRKWWVVKHNW